MRRPLGGRHVWAKRLVPRPGWLAARRITELPCESLPRPPARPDLGEQWQGPSCLRAMRPPNRCAACSSRPELSPSRARGVVRNDRSSSGVERRPPAHLVCKAVAGSAAQLDVRWASPPPWLPRECPPGWGSRYANPGLPRDLARLTTRPTRHGTTWISEGANRPLHDTVRLRFKLATARSRDRPGIVARHLHVEARKRPIGRRVPLDHQRPAAG